MTDLAIEAQAAPPGPGSDVFPVWTNLSDNWRAEDAHWLRNRSIQIFTGVAQRNSEMGSGGANAVYGMLSIIPKTPPAPAPVDPNLSVYGGPDFWNGGAWESVRYPNLAVDWSVANQISLKYLGAGSGIVMDNNGAV